MNIYCIVSRVSTKVAVENFNIKTADRAKGLKAEHKGNPAVVKSNFKAKAKTNCFRSTSAPASIPCARILYQWNQLLNVIVLQICTKVKKANAKLWKCWPAASCPWPKQFAITRNYVSLLDSHLLNRNAAISFTLSRLYVCLFSLYECLSCTNPASWQPESNKCYVMLSCEWIVRRHVADLSGFL